VVDLSRVTVIDRAGLVVLLRLRAQARTSRIQPVLADPSPAIQHLLHDLGVAALFRTAGTCGQAVTLALLTHHANASPTGSLPPPSTGRRGSIPAPRHQT
jgi:STAS domain